MQITAGYHDTPSNSSPFAFSQLQLTGLFMMEECRKRGAATPKLRDASRASRVKHVVTWTCKKHDYRY